MTDLNNSTSFCNLAMEYYKSKNYDEMKKYFLMAIDKGNLFAMNNLGLYYKYYEKNYDLMKKY